MRVRFVDHYSFTDGDRWITVHPNGKENKGTPVKLDEATDIVMTKIKELTEKEPTN